MHPCCRLGALLGLVAALCAAAAALTPEDLVALAKHSAWRELLERAEEIAPAGRTEQWRGFVQQAATSEVKKSDDPLARAETIRHARVLRVVQNARMRVDHPFRAARRTRRVHQ